MHTRLTVLLLLAVLPVMNVLAAPVPDPSAVLDIGPPPKGKTAEEYCRDEIDHLTHPYGVMFNIWLDPEVKQFPSVAASKDSRAWLLRNLRVTPEDEGRRLRLTFRGGNRREQVAILNLVLRINLKHRTRKLHSWESLLQAQEEGLPRLKELIATTKDPVSLAKYQESLESSPSRIAECRAEIARRKQYVVIKRAK